MTAEIVMNMERISTLEQLEAACTRKLVVPLQIFDKVVEVEARMLLDDERERVEQILLEVVPPLKAPPDGGHRPPLQPHDPGGHRPPLRDEAPAPRQEFDVSDTGYVEKLRRHQKMARAVTLYLCVPMFQARFPGLEGREQILEAVASCHLTEAVLNTLYAVVLGENYKIEEQVNFSSPRGKTPPSARGSSTRRQRKPRTSGKE
jgi:hypothetical protein